MAKKKKNSLGQEDLEFLEGRDLEDLDETEADLEDLEDLKEIYASEEEELSKLSREVEQLKDEIAIERNKFLKAHADLENTKKRLSNDFAKRSKYMVQDFALSLLPALDNMEKVLSDTQDNDNLLHEAVDMIYRQLKTSLNAEGVEEIEALGKEFDPNFHHAIMLEEVDDKTKDKVIEVLQKGYKLKDRVLRASMVKVGK